MGYPPQRAKILETTTTATGTAYDGCKWFSNHAFEVSADGVGVTAASVIIEAKLDPDDYAWTVLGNTDTSPLHLPATGIDSQLQISGQSFRQVRARCTAVTRSADNLRVHYMGS